MAYDIGIGEPRIFADEKIRSVFVHIEKIDVAEAPVWESEVTDPWPELIGKGNHTYPSVESFELFCSVTGLHQLFFNTLICSPGETSLIKAEDLIVIRAAKTRWVNAHPNSVAGWRKNEDDILANLIWYEFWFNWALANCEKPAIQFS